jgi:calcineurin-like phosphoesterase family protein
MTTFFTADHHFGHANIIKYSNRPFDTVQQMDAELIRRWNSVVSHGDMVYYVGDFTLRSWRESLDFIRQLNGSIYFMPGSHDKWMTDRSTPYLALPPHIRFLPALHVLSYSSEAPSITLCHYAMRSWDRSHYASWHLFGHHHGSLPAHGLSFDIGVDCWDFYPVSYKQVSEKMTTLTPIVDYSKKR